VVEPHGDGGGDSHGVRSGGGGGGRHWSMWL
jgi:hypothetical protein